MYYWKIMVLFCEYVGSKLQGDSQNMTGIKMGGDE